MSLDDQRRGKAAADAQQQLLTMYETEWRNRAREYMRAHHPLPVRHAAADTVRAHMDQYRQLTALRYEELGRTPGLKRSGAHEELAVPCKSCGVDVGVYCQSKTGKRAAPHGARLREVGIEPEWVREDVDTTA